MPTASINHSTLPLIVVQVRHTGYVVLSREGEAEEGGQYASSSSDMGAGGPASDAAGAATPMMSSGLEVEAEAGLDAMAGTPPSSVHAWRLEQDVRGDRGVGWLELEAED